MSVPNYTRFLSECIIEDPDKQPGLLQDDIYGVYLSWCFLNGERPGSDAAFCAALEQRGYSQHGNNAGRYPGLSMTGPAAVDYILASQPSLV